MELEEACFSATAAATDEGTPPAVARPDRAFDGRRNVS
jgi:hypothetical protein